MRVLTYDEMTNISGGKDLACAIAGAGLAAAEVGLVLGLMSGGLGFAVAVVGVAASLYGTMASCT